MVEEDVEQNENEEIVKIPLTVTRTEGLCSGGSLTHSLILMIIMWICTSINFMIT
jgi:hypothetical protein